MGGKVYLYKGGTEGAANTGNEPYSEFYAAHRRRPPLGVHAIPYGLSRWKGVLCSTCELFTGIRRMPTSLSAISFLRAAWGLSGAYYEKMGDKFVNALNEMLVFDAVICNVDRHFGNFGVMVDNRTNTIVSPAPLFDHGNSSLTLQARTPGRTRLRWRHISKRCTPACTMIFSAQARTR